MTRKNDKARRLENRNRLMREQREAGLPVQSIAEYWGVCVRTVYNAMEPKAVSKRARDRSINREWKDTGWTQAAIAQRRGLHVRTVVRAVRSQRRGPGKAQRNERIRAEYDGSNWRELAGRYGLSRGSIFRILAQGRKE